MVIIITLLILVLVRGYLKYRSLMTWRFLRGSVCSISWLCRGHFKKTEDNCSQPVTFYLLPLLHSDSSFEEIPYDFQPGIAQYHLFLFG